MTVKERIIRYLERLDENNEKDKEKLELILSIVDRIFIGLKPW